MPTRFALMRTSFSNSSGRRRLIDVSLRFNSKRIGTMPEKSYTLRSAVSTKASASSSVLKSGNFYFMSCYLLCVHIPRTDRSYQNRFTIPVESIKFHPSYSTKHVYLFARANINTNSSNSPACQYHQKLVIQKRGSKEVRTITISQLLPDLTPLQITMCCTLAILHILYPTTRDQIECLYAYQPIRFHQS